MDEVKSLLETYLAVETPIDLQGATTVDETVKAMVLTSGALTDENSLQAPRKIYPQEGSLTISGPRFTYEFQPHSLTMLRVKVR